MNFFRQYPKLMSIELNGIELTPTILENLQKFVPQEIKSIIMRNCIIAKDEHYDLVADFIGKHANLESITLVFPDLCCEESNKLFSALQGHKNLKFLNLVVAEISDESVGHLKEMLTGSAETLEGLSLGVGKITGKEEEPSYEHIADAVGQLKKIESLELAFMSLPEAAFAHVAECLKELKTLKTLRLFFGDTSSHNHIKLFEHTETLQKSLEILENLEVFDVSANDLPEESIQLIAMAIKGMKKLKTLNISGNPISAKSAAVLAESFKENVSVATLIANNCSMDDSAMSALLGKGESVASLQYLYLRDNTVKDGIKSLPVSVMTDLKVIDLSGNQIDYDGVIAFVDSVAEHPNLQAINFKNNTGINNADDEEKSRRHDELEKKRIEKKVRVAFFGV
jgi:Leucine-rich repeat (LRR) protein